MTVVLQKAGSPLFPVNQLVARPVGPLQSSRLHFKTLPLTLVLVFGASACSDSSAPPAPDWSSLPDQAAEAVRLQYEAMLDAPDDADAAGRLAMHLHAYEQWQAAERFYADARRKDPRSAAWPYLRAYVLEQIGEADSARAAYYEALAVDASSVPARLRLAELLFRDGEFAEAEELYRSVLELQPVSAAAEYGLGRIAAERGDDSAAVGRFETSIAAAPQYSAARYALAQAYSRLGEQQKAEQQTALVEGSLRVAEAFFDPLLFEVQGLRAGSASEHLRRGKELADRGLHREAVDEYNLAIEADPAYADAYVNLMTAYGALGEYAKAEEQHRKATALGSDAPELHYNLGLLRGLQERYDEAVPAFRRALERDPAMADAHSNLGYALQQLGRPEEAVGHYRAALEQQPNHRLTRFYYGMYLLGAGRPRDALSRLEPAIAPLDVRSPRILFAVAEAHMRLGRPDEARRELLRALELAEGFGQTDLIEGLRTALNGLSQ